MRSHRLYKYERIARVSMKVWCSCRARKFSQERPIQIYHSILVALTLYINSYDFIFGKQQKSFAKEIYLYIYFLLTYILNALKINDLYMTKKSILKGK